MTLQGDLIATKEAIAGKRARIQFLFDGVDRLEGSAREERASAIKSANTDLRELIDKLEKLQTEYDMQTAESASRKAMRQPVGRQIDPSEDSGTAAGRTRAWSAEGSWGEAVVKANDEQGGLASGMKSLLPSGTAIVGVPVRGPVEDPRRARFLADLMPTQDEPSGYYAYLRQTVRANTADEVEEGAVKPTSVYTTVKEEGSIPTIAHLSEPIPRQRLEESSLVQQFVDGELRLGLNLALDDKIVAAVQAVALQQGYISTDPLVTTRRALTRLEEREVIPSAYVMHPRDWEEVELTASTTYAASPNMPGPVDAMKRSLWGIPVVTTTALAEGSIILGDFRDSAVLFTTGGIRVDWSEASHDAGTGTSDFERNMVRFRAERRAKAGILRSFAFIEIALPGTGS